MALHLPLIARFFGLDGSRLPSKLARVVHGGKIRNGNDGDEVSILPGNKTTDW